MLLAPFSIELYISGIQEARMDIQEEQKNSLPVNAQNNGHAITALVAGILSVIAPFALPGFGSMVGIILGIIGLYQVTYAKRIGESSLAQSGKTLSIIGLVVSAAALIFCIVFTARMAGFMNWLWDTRPWDPDSHMFYYRRFGF